MASTIAFNYTAQSKDVFSDAASTEEEHEEERLSLRSKKSSPTGIGLYTLNKAISWADMEDDSDPFLNTAASSDAETTTTCRSDESPQTQVKSLSPSLSPQAAPAAPRDSTPPATKDLSLVPSWRNSERQGAEGRTPLSAKSRPFVSTWCPPPLPPAPFTAQWEPSPVHCDASPPQAPFAQEAQAEIKLKDKKTKAKVTVAPDKHTTVMLRGLPSEYNRKALLDLLDAKGFSGQYNFAYLPVDFQTGESAGYAFVNLLQPTIAIQLKQLFEGYAEYPFSPTEVCEVCWSRVQGLTANIKQYRNSPVMSETVPVTYKPMLFRNGAPLRFPEPTMNLKDVRWKRRGKKHAGKDSDDMEAGHDSGSQDQA